MNPILPPSPESSSRLNLKVNSKRYSTRNYLYAKQIHFWILIGILLLTTGAGTYAQEVLVGLTSSGGPNLGYGTAFSIKTTGQDFKVNYKFYKMGVNPHGDLVKGKDGFFYGMTSLGGNYNYGTIFKMSSSGIITILRHLNFADGTNPHGSLIQGFDGNFYGMAKNGGTSDKYNTKGHGTIFKISSTGTFSVLKKFNIDTGAQPSGSLIQGSDGNFYGMTKIGGYLGGKYGEGTIFKITAAGVFTVIYLLDYNNKGYLPHGGLVQGDDGNFYGMAQYSQHLDDEYVGIIFKVTPTGTYTVLRILNKTTEGGVPRGSLIKGTDGHFYGMTRDGGSSGVGTVFRITSVGTFTLLKNLNLATTGGYPEGSLVQGNDGYLYGMTSYGGSKNYGTISKMTIAGVLTVLRHLNHYPDGARPYGSLYKNSDGTFYGMTSEGGTKYQSGIGFGTVFKISATGTFTLLTTMPDGTNGYSPMEGLMQAKDGNYYGTAYSGGTNGGGTIFKLSPTGTFTKLRSLNPATNGSKPHGNLVQGTDGNFYGMASNGGPNNWGTIYRLTPTGTLTVLYYFDLATTGGRPYGGLIQGKDGSFYGMTNGGGSNNNGTIFKITTSGTLTVLNHLKSSTTGAYPLGDLVQGNDGNFYGMITQGDSNYGTRHGTIFKMTPSGSITVLRKFIYNSDGGFPYGSLIKGIDGNFYGMTRKGGLYDSGTAFKITPGGTFTVLHHFQSATEGKPEGNLVQGGDGTFYGMTYSGGNYDAGTLFKMTASGSLTVLRHFNPLTVGGHPGGSLTIQKNIPVTTPSVLTARSLASEIVSKGSSHTATQVVLFPNPATTCLTLKLNNPAVSVTTTITDALSKVITKKINQVNETGQFEVEVSQLKPGNYLLVIQSDQMVQTMKFIKQ